MHRTDCEFMKKALELAEKGLGLASPNPSVGCVLVKDGEIIGKGWHEYELKEHAEIMALREAGDRACGSTAYVTLEPCSHYGRTSPCAERLVSAGISRVVVGCIDPNPLVSGNGIELLRSAGVTVEVGAVSEEARKMIPQWISKFESQTRR